MALVAGQIAKDGATEAITQEEGSMPVMTARKEKRAGMGSNAQESYWTPSRVDRQRLCGGGVMGAGSVRTGVELKMLTAGTLMKADKAMRVLAGRQTSAAKGKLRLVFPGLKKTESARTSRSCRLVAAASCRPYTSPSPPHRSESSR